jgi:hypothetical protein
MELGSVVWFSSRKRPFVVRERHCLDLTCACTDAWLTLTEIDLEGCELRTPLTFEIRVNLRNGRERRPPQRSPEIRALVREFLVRFPVERFQEMIDRRREQRTIQQRLEQYTVQPSERGELLGYSSVIYPDGDLRQNGQRFSFFFAYDGRDYLLEDHYCPTPGCDCRTVHMEFWERSELPGRTPRVEIVPRLRARFALTGEFRELEFCEDDPQFAEQLARAWVQQSPDQLEVCRQRYRQIKEIGERSGIPRLTAALANESVSQRPGAERSLKIEGPHPPPSTARGREDRRSRVATGAGSFETEPGAETSPIKARVGRNDPCPCGSGRKFKRCCARR